MLTRTQKRKAISTVLTTLIILVASVVLGTGVVLYGTSLFQTGARSQAITTAGTQVWVDSTNSSGYAWGAAAIRNSGDKLLSVDTISIRGNSIPFANWYADTSATRVTTANLQSTMNYTGIMNKATGALYNGTAGGTHSMGVPTPVGCSNTSGTLIMELQPQSAAGYQALCLTQQTGPISLQPGSSTIVYFKVPQNVLTSVDAGASSSVAIYAGQVGSPTTVTIASK